VDQTAALVIAQVNCQYALDQGRRGLIDVLDLDVTWLPVGRSPFWNPENGAF